MRPRLENRSRWESVASRWSKFRGFAAALGLLTALAGGEASAVPLADPSILPGSFIGGEYDVTATGFTLAPNGDMIVVGYTDSTDLPVTSGSMGGYIDAFVARFDSKARTLKWLRYLGGSGGDYASAVAVDGGGNVYVLGATDSTDFPLTGGAYSTTFVGLNGDLFVAKLAAADGSVIWASLLGSSGTDAGLDIAVDGSNRPIVVGYTISSDFPMVADVGTPSNDYEGFVTRFTAAGDDLEFSSHYGTAWNDEVVAVGVDGADDIYLGVHSRAFETPDVANEIVKIDGTSLLVSWSNPLDMLLLVGMGGFSEPVLEDIAVSPGGIVAYSGSLEGFDLPAPYPWQNVGGYDLFVGKLDALGDIDWNDFVGGTSGESDSSLALTSDEKIWIVANSYSDDYPLRHALFPFGKVAVSLLSADGEELLESTRIGGWVSHQVFDIAVDGDGVPSFGGNDFGPPVTFPLTGLLPPGERYSGFVVRVEPVPNARLLPRRSVPLPPLERIIEEYPGSQVDLDGDGIGEQILELFDRPLDLAWDNVVADRLGDGRDLLIVAIGNLGGSRVVGVLDYDGDGEPEMVVEDPRRDARAVEGWLLDSGDQDVDVLVVGSGGAPGVLLVDLDGDGNQEVVVGAPHLADGAVAIPHLSTPWNPDVVFIGGIPRGVVDLDLDEELEVIAERGGTGGTVSVASVDVVSDGDDDIVFLVGTYAFARDFDGDGRPEIVAEDHGASPGTVSVVAPVIFVGGEPQTTADLDWDDELELVVYDSAAADGTMDPHDELDGSDGDFDVVFVGGVFRGTVDVDGDRERELVVEDGTVAADTFSLVDGIEPSSGDGDADLIAIRATVVAAVDLDDDGEQEIATNSGVQSPGDVVYDDGAEAVPDADADVFFVGGSVVAFVDFDGDWELELAAEDGGVASGAIASVDLPAGLGDGDQDVLFVAGTWRASRDLDLDGETELVVEDSGLGSAKSTADFVESVLPDGDPDTAYVKAPFLTLLDLDGDGEPEIVVEDSGVSAPAVVYSDFIEPGIDTDIDLVAIPTTDGWQAADLDADGEIDLILEHTGATAAATTRLDGAEGGGGDSDGDVYFAGGIPQLTGDFDDDDEIEVVLASGITAGTVSVYRSAEGSSSDPDLIYVGGTARGIFDADGDSDLEVVVENGSAGGSTGSDTVEDAPDSDLDVIFIGGVVRLFTDVDGDGEQEAIAESSSYSPGAAIGDDADADTDADAIFVAGFIQGAAIFDDDIDREVVATDANLYGGTALDPSVWDSDGDADAVLIGTNLTAGSGSLTVTGPNGGETYTVGDPVFINWTASGFAGTVRIELSRDGGSTWEVIFANTDNDGSETWTSAGDPTATALIRVISRNLATPVDDESNATFTLL